MFKVIVDAEFRSSRRQFGHSTGTRNFRIAGDTARTPSCRLGVTAIRVRHIGGSPRDQPEGRASLDDGFAIFHPLSLHAQKQYPLSYVAGGFVVGEVPDQPFTAHLVHGTSKLSPDGSRTNFEPADTTICNCGAG